MELSKYYGIEYADGVQMVMFSYPIMDRRVCIMNDIPDIEGNDIGVCTNEQCEQIKERNGLSKDVTVETLWNALPIQKSTDTYVTVVQEHVKWCKAQKAIKDWHSFLTSIIPSEEYNDQEACVEKIKNVLKTNPEAYKSFVNEEMASIVNLAQKVGLIP